MRRLLWSAALLLALLAGCAAQETAGDAVQPVNFYYPRVTPAYGQADGCLAAEVYDWGAQEMTSSGGTTARYSHTEDCQARTRPGSPAP